MPGPVNGVVLVGIRVTGSKTAASDVGKVKAAYADAGKTADKASTGFGRFNRGLDASAEHGAKWLEGARSIAAGWLGINAAFEAGDFFKDTIKAAAEGDALNKSYALTLQNVTHATAEQVKEQQEWIEKQAASSVFSKGDLIPAMQTLISATGDVEKAHKLMSLAMDVSIGRHISLGKAALALSRAQNGNIAGLAKLGIATKVQISNSAAVLKAQTGVVTATMAQNKALAKYGAHSGQYEAATMRLKSAQEGLAKAHQSVAYRTLTSKQVLDNLTKTYKGQAAGAADTYDGRLKILSHRFEAIKETIGNHLMPVLTSVSGWFLKNIGVIGTLTAVLLGTYAAFKAYKVIVWGVQAATTAWNVVQGIAVFLSGEAEASYAISGAALKAYMVMTKIATAGQWLWNAAVDAFPGVWIVAAIAAVVAAVVIAVVLIVKHWKQISHAFSDVWHAIIKFIPKAWAGIKSGVANGWHAVWGFLSHLPGQIVGLFGGAGSWLVGAGVKLLGGLWKGIESGAKNVGGFVGNIAVAIVNGVIGFINSVVIDPFDSALHGIGAFGVHPFGEHTIPDIPKLANGGRVYPSGAIVNIAEAGRPETVLNDPQLKHIVAASAKVGAAQMPEAMKSAGQIVVKVEMAGEDITDLVTTSVRRSGGLA